MDETKNREHNTAVVMEKQGREMDMKSCRPCCAMEG